MTEADATVVHSIRAGITRTVIEHEARLLGRCLVSPEIAAQVVAELRPEEFAAPAHQALFRAITEAVQAGGRVSAVMVQRILDRHGASARVGDLAAYLEEPALPVEVEAIVALVREHGLRRRLREIARNLARLADDPAELDDLVAAAAEQASAIFALGEVGEEPVVSLGDALSEVVAAASDPSRRRYRRLAFGFPSTLGHILRGLGVGRLHVIAARPGMGKTSLAMQMVTEACRVGGARTVLVVSLEMLPEELADVVARQETGRSLLASDATEALSEIDADLVRLQGYGVYISRRRGLGVREIAAMARRVAVEHGGLDLLVVDHLQLIRLPAGHRDNRAQAVGDAALALRNLAGDLEMPVILLSQLNRGVEARDNKRPQLADLRDSGNIEEHADVVLGIYRHDYYEPELPEGDPRRDMAEIGVLKNRGGASGATVVLRWSGPRMRFDEPDPEERLAYLRAMARAGTRRSVPRKEASV